MKVSDVFRRTPVRLAVLFTTLFVTTAVLIFAGLYVQLGRELEKEIRRRADDTAVALATVGRQKGFEELADLIESSSGSARADDTILLLETSTGRFRAGNVRNIEYSEGWLSLVRSKLTMRLGRPDDLFLAKWYPVQGGRLLVGVIDREIRRTRHILLEGLLWALAGTALVAGLSSSLLARSAQSRISAFAATLEAVNRGRLDARVAMSGLGDDIDDIGEQVNRTLHQLKTLVENVNQSSSDIAHDLKKPIGRLQQRLDEARRTAEEPDEFRRAIEAALRDLDSIVETFEALLNITQIEAGARKSRFKRIDLTSVIDDIRDIYEPVIDDQGQSLDVALERFRPAFILGDRELLIQLFANLIENSIQHCPQGTKITITLTETDLSFVVAVSDNGPGIPLDERSNVLRRLYRLERSRSTPGNGLGLSLVSAVADLHDASLVLSDNEPGLRVSLSLPRADG